MRMRMKTVRERNELRGATKKAVCGGCGACQATRVPRVLNIKAPTDSPGSGKVAGARS